jgi:hypothetical protein
VDMAGNSGWVRPWDGLGGMASISWALPETRTKILGMTGLGK